MIHPVYNLLNESWYDMAETPLRIVQHTAQALGLTIPQSVLQQATELIQ